MIFLLDNYDSFTYNLYDYLAQLGCEVYVERNDNITVEQIENIAPQALVISPGPGKPRHAGTLMEIISSFHTVLPILGICLGYQAIGEFFGAELTYAPRPMHGKTTEIIFDTKYFLFHNIPQKTEVMRYHSLNIKNIPDALEVTAQTASGEPMAIQHKHLPVCGVQFHPESVLTTHGMQMLQNWYAACIL
jgi:anthranilate synthase/aminodeoxychorismate synthase-like glutamine amidotransferase